jgi:hypothetical protein
MRDLAVITRCYRAGLAPTAPPQPSLFSVARRFVVGDRIPKWPVDTTKERCESVRAL